MKDAGCKDVFKNAIASFLSSTLTKIPEVCHIYILKGETLNNHLKSSSMP